MSDSKPDDTKPYDPVERPNTDKAEEEGDDGVVTSQPPRTDAATQQAPAADVDASDERADVAEMSDRPDEQHSLEMQEATEKHDAPKADDVHAVGGTDDVNRAMMSVAPPREETSSLEDSASGSAAGGQGDLEQIEDTT